MNNFVGVVVDLATAPFALLLIAIAVATVVAAHHERKVR